MLKNTLLLFQWMRNFEYQQRSTQRVWIWCFFATEMCHSSFCIIKEFGKGVLLIFSCFTGSEWRLSQIFYFQFSFYYYSEFLVYYSFLHKFHHLVITCILQTRIRVLCMMRPHKTELLCCQKFSQFEKYVKVFNFAVAPKNKKQDNFLFTI